MPIYPEKHYLGGLDEVPWTLHILLLIDNGLHKFLITTFEKRIKCRYEKEVAFATDF